MLINRVISALYLACLGYAIYNMIPTKEEKEEMKYRRTMKKGGDEESSEIGSHVHKVYEMHSSKMQHDHQTPFTPRTQAFHALDRTLPLRGQ